MMKLLAVASLQKHFFIDIWGGSKYGSAASFFNIFPPSLFDYLNEYMNILFLFWKCAATSFIWCKSKILYDISLVPKLFTLYLPRRCQIFICLCDRGGKKLTLKTWNTSLIKILIKVLIKIITKKIIKTIRSGDPQFL